MDHGVIDETAILELMMTGDKEVDQQIITWVAQIKKQYNRRGIDIFETIWNNCFGLRNRPLSAVAPSDILRMNVLEKLAHATFIYLIARKLAIVVHDSNISSQTAAEYQDHAVWWRDFSGSVIADALKEISTIKTVDRIIIEADNRRKTCVVYGENYRDWLKNGNCVELLLGSMLGNRPSYTAYDFAKNKEQYERDWSSYKLFYDATIENQSANRLRDAIRYCFNTSMNTPHEEEVKYFQHVSLARENINKYLEEELAQLHLHDVNEPSLAIERIVSKARFYYTDVGVFLKKMREHPDIAPREAALLATICYIVHYLTNQIHLTTKL